MCNLVDKPNCDKTLRPYADAWQNSSFCKVQLPIGEKNDFRQKYNLLSSYKCRTYIAKLSIKKKLEEFFKIGE
jgi:hypothetical protein